MRILFLVIIAAFLASCNNHKNPDRWDGKWPGVEGTYLALGSNGDAVEVNIQNLDHKVQTYQGKKVGSHIEFVRNGINEKIKFADGKATGMKWFADKKKCLVIKPGEGFCRK